MQYLKDFSEDSKKKYDKQGRLIKAEVKERKIALRN